MTKAKSGISSMGTVSTFLKGRACSDTLSHVLNRAFDHPLKLEERAAMPFAGGIMQHGYQCGMIWGATLAAGAQAYRLFGAGPQAEAKAILAAQLTGGEGTSISLSDRAEFISLNATGAYFAAIRKQPIVPPFIRKYLIIWIVDDDLSILVISRQFIWLLRARKDSTSLWAAIIALVSACGPGPRSRYACAPAASVAPQIIPHW